LFSFIPSNSLLAQIYFWGTSMTKGSWTGQPNPIEKELWCQKQIVRAGWEAFNLLALDERLQKEIKEVAEAAFYAGAAYIFDAMNFGNLNNEPMTSMSLGEVMIAVDAELTSWRKTKENGHRRRPAPRPRRR
jgi:hypothetical protein